MKKFSIAIITFVLLGLIGITFIEPLLLSTSTGQKLYLWSEGDEAAHFYFKEGDDVKSTVYMTGVIYTGTPDDIKLLLKKYPQIQKLVLINVPGSIDDEANLVASLAIHRSGITTHIPADSFVASGGTDMFLAGVKRTNDAGAKIGVHSWVDGEKTAREYERNNAVHQPYLDYYQQVNIPESFYWYTLDAAPADSIHWMTMSEIQKYDVLTSFIDTTKLINRVKVLADDNMKGRATGKNKAAQAVILSQFNQYHLKMFKNDFEQPFSFIDEKTKKSRKGTNLVGYLKGKESPNDYIVIGAHYDHLGVIDNKIFNGADDNASGTSAMLSLVEYFSTYPPHNSIIFVAYDAEELGIHGSIQFLKNPPIDLNQIKMNFNFDMIGRNIKNEVYIVGTYYYPEFKEILASASKNIDLQVSYGHDDPNDNNRDYWMKSSDNAPYFLKQIPNITFSEEDHPDYHKESDEFDGIDQIYYKQVVKLIIKSISQIDANLAKLIVQK